MSTQSRSKRNNVLHKQIEREVLSALDKPSEDELFLVLILDALEVQDKAASRIKAQFLQ